MKLRNQPLSRSPNFETTKFSALSLSAEKTDLQLKVREITLEKLIANVQTTIDSPVEINIA